ARRRHAVTAAPAITTPRRIPVARSSDSQPISTTPLVVEAARRRPERSAGRSNGDDSSLGRLGKRKARSRLGGASGGNSRGGRVAIAPVLDPDGVAGALRERERLERKAAGGVGAVGLRDHVAGLDARRRGRPVRRDGLHEQIPRCAGRRRRGRDGLTDLAVLKIAATAVGGMLHLWWQRYGLRWHHHCAIMMP